MRTVQIVCSTTRDYWEKIRPYLTTLNAFGRPAISTVLGVETIPPEGYLDALPNLKFSPISDEENYGAPEGTSSIQHGSFVERLSIPDDDVVIYTDGDILMQRGFSRLEWGLLQGWADDTVGVSWNSGPNEMLIHEAVRLSPRGTTPDIIAEWGDAVEIFPCYNIGVLIATGKTWRRIYDQYLRDWVRVGETFAHRARQQWLVSYEIAALGLRPTVLPYYIHTHAHYGLPEGVGIFSGLATVEDRVILFRHRF